ncbi:MAG: hypothetical protein C0501_06655 [Isosphaera sp.]|nr:hypothetical protein [Isosphaera sp.]
MRLRNTARAAGVAAALALGSVVAAPVPKPPPPLTEAELDAKVYGSWVEVEGGKEAGKPVPGYGWGWKLDPKAAETWDAGLSLGPYWKAEANTAVVPWRLDVFDKSDSGRVVVKPGIFRLDGDALVWVTDDGWCEWNKTGEYAARPKELTSTEKNGYTLRVLKRCDYLQTRFDERDR